jgi:hypothetical protein
MNGRINPMSKSHLLCAGTLLGSALLLSHSAANASKELTGDKCVFESSAASYGGGAPEPISLTWNHRTGKIIAFSWNNRGTPWYSYAAEPGTVTQETPGGYYYHANIGLTTAGYDTTRYQLKGYIAINIDWPDATFAAIYEGTGTSYMVAHGKVKCS